MSLILDGTNGETFPSWTTATRPASPVVGQMGYNTTTGNFDAYTAAGWVTIASSSTPAISPAFSAYLASNQSVTTNTLTKVTINTKEFDTNSNFDNTTNYRFTPTVAGYYQINGAVNCNGTANTGSSAAAYIYKNGSLYKGGGLFTNSGSGTENNVGCVISCVVYFNGSTDYVELWGTITQTSPYFVGGTYLTYFNGCYLAAN